MTAILQLILTFILAGTNPHIAARYHNPQYTSAVVACNGNDGLFIGYESRQAWARQPQYDQVWGGSRLVVWDRWQVVEGPVAETSLWTGACR